MITNYQNDKLRENIIWKYYKYIYINVYIFAKMFSFFKGLNKNL